MAEFVLDASVAISWCFPGDPSEDTPFSRRILSMLTTNEAVVPAVWCFEIANALFVSFSRRKRITEQQIQEYLECLKALPIRVEPCDLWITVELESSARKWDLSAYDAAYVALARAKRFPLATNDRDLKSRALSEGVQLL